MTAQVAADLRAAADVLEWDAGRARDRRARPRRVAAGGGHSMNAATVLRRAAQALNNGTITWGREYFIRSDDGCRCALGAIAWAADPANPDGDPRFVEANRDASNAAVTALAAYLVEVGVPLCIDVEYVPDLIETVGGYNDEQTDALPVIVAMEAAADRISAAAVTA